MPHRKLRTDLYRHLRQLQHLSCGRKQSGLTAKNQIKNYFLEEFILSSITLIFILKRDSFLTLYSPLPQSNTFIISSYKKIWRKNYYSSLAIKTWVEEAGGGLGWGVGSGEDPPLTAIYSIPLSQDLRKTVRGLVDL